MNHARRKRPDPRADVAFLPHHSEKGTNVSLCSFSECIQWLRQPRFQPIQNPQNIAFPISVILHLLKVLGSWFCQLPKTIQPFICSVFSFQFRALIIYRLMSKGRRLYRRSPDHQIRNYQTHHRHTHFQPHPAQAILPCLVYF